MTLTEEEFRQIYDEKVFDGRLKKLEEKMKIEDLKQSDLGSSLSILCYGEQIRKMKKEINQAEYLHAFIIKRPNYHPTDSRLEPERKKVLIQPSCQIYGGKFIVRNVFDLEGTLFTDSLEEADIGVYVGNYLCDYKRTVNMGETGSPAIWPLLYASKDRELPLVVITNGSSYFRFCQGKCPEDKEMMELIREGKNINPIPLGYPYNREIPLS